MPNSVIPPPLTGTQLLDEYFIENRTRVLDIAAFLDRLDRAASSAEGDFRLAAFRETLRVLANAEYPRMKQVQMILSDPTTEPLAELDTKSARGAYSGPGGAALMRYIDLHAHMVSRTTEDYRQMALTGCVAVTEPAFWAGWDRSSAAGFEDYFRQLTTFEVKRAAEYGIQHYCWLCLNPKEGENRELARQVLDIIPRFLGDPTVLGIGEIGLNRNTRNELATFHDHVQLALEHDVPIHIHTPHLEDKYKGTKLIVEALASYSQLDPARVMIDHAEEHTLPMILEHGFWTGLTLYPQTKVSPQRAIDMIETHGADRICVASACDWGPSVPVAIPEFALAMRRRGHNEELIDQIIFGNPASFLGQSPKFRLPTQHTVIPAKAGTQ